MPALQVGPGGLLSGVPEGRTPPATSCVALEKQGEESGQALTRRAGLMDGAPAGAP